MDEAAMIEALKAGLKGERDSIAIYEGAAARGEGEVAAFFGERAEEERRHYAALLELYTGLAKGRLSQAGLRPLEPVGGAPRGGYVTPLFMARVAESRWLSAAVSAAVLLEATALGHYRAAAGAAPPGPLRSLFSDLADWEDSHYRELLGVQEESTRLWFEAQGFEPF